MHLLEKHIVVYAVSEVVCANINNCQETQNLITPSIPVVYINVYRLQGYFDPHKRLFMYIFHINKCSKWTFFRIYMPYYKYIYNHNMDHKVQAQQCPLLTKFIIVFASFWHRVLFNIKNVHRDW